MQTVVCRHWPVCRDTQVRRAYRVLHSQLLCSGSGHTDEVLDVTFNFTGQLLASASADGTVRVYDTKSFECVSTLAGHESEVSKARSYITSSNRVSCVAGRI